MTKEEKTLLICAFRYALGRMTYIVQDIVDVIIKRWYDIDDTTKHQIIKDIREAISKDNAGMACDVHEWERILKLND